MTINAVHYTQIAYSHNKTTQVKQETTPQADATKALASAAKYETPAAPEKTTGQKVPQLSQGVETVLNQEKIAAAKARGTEPLQPGSNPPEVPSGFQILNPDSDGDGKVGISDYMEISQQFGMTEADEGFDSRLDLNGDGEIGGADYKIWQGFYGMDMSKAGTRIIVNKPDMNNDGVVSVQDYLEISQSFGTQDGEKAYNPNADLNGDGLVDGADYNIWEGFYGQNVGVKTSA